LSSHSVQVAPTFRKSHGGFKGIEEVFINTLGKKSKRPAPVFWSVIGYRQANVNVKAVSKAATMLEDGTLSSVGQRDRTRWTTATIVKKHLRI